jgi:2',3'-cyclic-nucleotide 2'-phosphodiesterase (5'-nucleotidase family)
MIKIFGLLAILVTSIQGRTVFAKQFMLIHTNDLHSYFDGVSEKLGSYARVKTIIDKLKNEAKSKNMFSLVTDGGDWGEGTSFFYTNEGMDSLRLLEAIGVDVAVIGNHDHMQGGKVLAKQIRDSKVKTKFLSANIIQSPQMNLDNNVFAYHDFKIGNLKARIIGLSTDEIHHQAAIVEEKGKILDPVKVGCQEAKKAKQQGIDIVLALTHIGLKVDKKLARKCRGFDAILGGHSHTRLEKVVYRKRIPIIQTGSHTHAVAKLVLDYDEVTKKVKVVEYKLVDAASNIVKNKKVESLVEDVRTDRNILFNGQWDNIIGESKVPLYGNDFKEVTSGLKIKSRQNCWAKHMAKLTAKAVGTDFGAYLTSLGGQTIPAGKITYGDLIENFPHFRSFADKGWEIGIVKGPGRIVKKIIRLLILIGNRDGLEIFNAKFTGIVIPGSSYTIPLKIKNIKNKQEYSIAFPAELYFGIKAVAPNIAKELLPFYHASGQYYWPNIVSYVQSNSPITCI